MKQNPVVDSGGQDRDWSSQRINSKFFMLPIGLICAVDYEPRCEKTGLGVLTWSHTNRAVQPHKMTRGLKFCI